MELTAANYCDLCGSYEFVPELKVGRWELMRCNECGLVFTSPRYTEEAIAHLYTASYYQNTPAYYLSQMNPPSSDDRNLARTVQRILRQTGKSLDIGCGTGRLVEAFHMTGFQAAGIEPNEMAALAGQQSGRQITSTDLSKLPSHSMDCITAIHVLEHTYSPSSFLAQCSRIINDEGIIVVEVPNYASATARRLKERWEPLYPDTHLYQFTPETLSQYLINSGFRILSVRKIGGGGFLHGTPAPQPLELSTLAPPCSSLVGRICEWLWRTRLIVYRIPYMQEAVRFSYWQVLGQGEFVRIMARKESANLPPRRQDSAASPEGGTLR